MIGVNPANGNADDFEPIGQGVPAGQDVTEGMIEISARIRKGNLDFTMRDVQGNFVRFDEATRERFLAIDAKTRLTIRLSDVINWSFDVEAGPLRFKKEDSAPLYKVSFDPEDAHLREIVLEGMPSGVEPAAADAAQIHPFNLYIKVKQRLGSPWPLRLDPDIKNPPPPPQ